jgi:hypothetical protein
VDLDFRDGLLCCVVAGFVLGEPTEGDVHVGGIGFGDPPTEDDSGDEDNDCAKEGTEQVEHDDSGHTDGDEKLPFDPHVCQWPVKAFVNTVSTAFLGLWRGRHALATPQPRKYVHGERGDTNADGNAGEILFSAGLTRREADSAQNNGDDAGDFSYRSRE